MCCSFLFCYPISSTDDIIASIYDDESVAEGEFDVLTSHWISGSSYRLCMI